MRSRLLLYFALGGALFFVPFNLIRIQGYSAALAGAAFLPFSLIMGVLSRWSGGLIDRYGARKLLTIGPAIVAVGFALLAVPDIGGSYWTTFFPSMVVLGFGMAVSVAPLTTSVMRAVDDHHAGIASGINNATARIAGMLAVAVLGMVAIGVFGAALDERLGQMSLSNETRELVRAEIPKLAEAQVPRSIDGAQRNVLQQAFKESFVQQLSHRVAGCGGARVGERAVRVADYRRRVIEADQRAAIRDRAPCRSCLECQCGPSCRVASSDPARRSCSPSCRHPRQNTKNHRGRTQRGRRGDGRCAW